MTAGLNPVIANQILNSLYSAAAFTPPAGSWAQLHIGDPGVNGTSNPSSVTTRQSVTWATAAGGGKAESSAPSWGIWAGASPETITHVSVWSASTAGTFVRSFALDGGGVTVVTGQLVTLPTLSDSFAPVAA